MEVTIRASLELRKMRYNMAVTRGGINRKRQFHWRFDENSQRAEIENENCDFHRTLDYRRASEGEDMPVVNSAAATALERLELPADETGLAHA